MKKVFMMIAIMICLVTMAFSQERVIKETASFIGNVGQLSTATGWRLSTDKEWLSLSKTIPQDLLSEHKNLLTYEEYGLGDDNFISYTMKKMSHEGKSYCVLIKMYRDGRYKYPNIREDWFEYTSTIAYIFTEEEFNKINVIDNKINLIEISLVDVIVLRCNTDISLILTKFQPGANTVSKLYLYIASYKEKNIVQFQIKDNNYRMDKSFGNYYYETDYTSFDNFIKLDNNTRVESFKNATNDDNSVESLLNRSRDVKLSK